MKENSSLFIGDGSSSWTNRCRWCVSRSKAGASKRKNENKAVEGEEDGPVSTLFRFESPAPGVGKIPEDEWVKFEAQCVSLLQNAEKAFFSGKSSDQTVTDLLSKAPHSRTIAGGHGAKDLSRRVSCNRVFSNRDACHQHQVEHLEPMSRRLSGQDDVGRHGNDEDGEDGGAEDDSGRDGCGHCVLPCPPELDPRCPRVETICRTRPPYGEAISGSLAARRCNEDQQGRSTSENNRQNMELFDCRFAGANNQDSRMDDDCDNRDDPRDGFDNADCNMNGKRRSQSSRRCSQDNGAKQLGSSRCNSLFEIHKAAAAADENEEEERPYQLEEHNGEEAGGADNNDATVTNDEEITDDAAPEDEFGQRPSRRKSLDGGCPNEEDICSLPEKDVDEDNVMLTPRQLCRSQVCSGELQSTCEIDDSRYRQDEGFSFWIPWVTLLFLGFLYAVYSGLLCGTCKEDVLPQHDCLSYSSVICNCQYVRLWSAQLGFYDVVHFIFVFVAYLAMGSLIEYYFGHMYVAGLTALAIFLTGLLYIPTAYAIANLYCAEDLLKGCTLGLSGALLALLVVMTDRLFDTTGTIVAWVLMLIPLVALVLVPYPNTVPLHVAGILAGWLLTLADMNETVCCATAYVAFAGTRFVNNMSPIMCFASSMAMAYASYHLMPISLTQTSYEPYLPIV